MKGFADELIGDVRTVIVARIDMIDSARQRFAQYRERALPVFRRPEYPRPRELHRAVAHPLHAASPQREDSGIADIDHACPHRRCPPPV